MGKDLKMPGQRGYADTEEAYKNMLDVIIRKVQV